MKTSNAAVMGPRRAARPAPPEKPFVRGAFSVVGYLLAWPVNLPGEQARVWYVSPGPEVQIGETSGEEAYLFQSIESVRFLPDGGMVVADAGFLDIRIFGSTGVLRARMGGRGRGPGEFRSIMGMWLTSTGAIAAWDPVNLRITTFDSEGNRLSADRVEARAGANLQVFFGSFTNDDVALASLNSGPQKSGELVADVWIVQRYNLERGYLAPLGPVDGMRRFDRTPVPFSAMPFVNVRGDSLFVSDGYEARITVRDANGITARILELPLPPVPSADGVWPSLEAALRRRAPAGGSAGLLLEHLVSGRVPRDNRFPLVAGFLLDGEGYVWVKAYDPLVDSIWLRERAYASAPGGVWQVFSPEDGRIVASVEVPDDLRPTEIKGNRLLGVTRDEFGVERVVVHALGR